MTNEIRQALAARDFEQIENIWMDMMESPDQLMSEFLDIAQELKKAHAGDRAFMLLELLAGHYESTGEPAAALEIYKHMINYTHDLAAIRAKIIDLYHRLNPKSVNLEEYVTLANLTQEENLGRAIERMEEYLRYDIGRLFYFDRYGLGEVVEIHPRRREVVITFEKKERHFLSFDVAAGLLKPVNPGQFLYLKYKEPAAYKAMAEQDPQGLIRSLLANFNEPMTAGAIKAALTGPVSADEAARILDKAKKKLEQDPNIRVTGRAQKTYQFIAAGVDRSSEALTAFKQAQPRERFNLAGEISRKHPEVFQQIVPTLIQEANEAVKQDPALALDIYLLCRDQDVRDGFTFDLDGLFNSIRPQNLLAGLVDLEHQKYIIGFIKKKNPQDWPKVLKELMLVLEDFPILNELEAQLREYPDLLSDVYQTIITLPGHYSKPFPWLLKKISEGEIERFLTPPYLPKIIAGLDFIRGQKAVVKKIFSLDRFDAIIQKAATEDAQRIMNAIMVSKAFAEFEKKDLHRIIEYHFPQLFVRTEDVIYATAEARRRKQAELEHILKVAIPENKKEISRAREFGDLSENFEYKAAKERQDQLYQRLKDLQAELARVRLIEPRTDPPDRVRIGTKVTLRDAAGNELAYTILGRWDTDLARNIIANEAPAARQLLNKKEGDKVDLSGITYTVHRIQAADLSSSPAGGKQDAN